MYVYVQNEYKMNMHCANRDSFLNSPNIQHCFTLFRIAKKKNLV